MSRNYHKLENIQENSVRFLIINCLTHHSNALFSKGLDPQPMITSRIVRRELVWPHFEENQVLCWRIFHAQLLKQFSKAGVWLCTFAGFFLFPHIFWEWRSQNTFISGRCWILYFWSWPSVGTKRKEGIFTEVTHITEWLTIVILKNSYEPHKYIP